MNVIERDWVKARAQEMKHVCNGEVAFDGEIAVCTMKNGRIVASVASDGTRMLIARIDKKGKYRLEDNSGKNQMMMTRSLSHSIEFLQAFGANPSVRIKQEGEKLGSVSVFAENEINKISFYGDAYE